MSASKLWLCRDRTAIWILLEMRHFSKQILTRRTGKVVLAYVSGLTLFETKGFARMEGTESIL